MSADLVQIVDAALLSASQRAGAHLACRPGCAQCCTGVFAISQQDAARLREGAARLRDFDGTRWLRLQQRVSAAVARLKHSFPGDPATGLLDDEAEASDSFDDFGDDEVCPVLDPATGTCDLYAHRPILCRTFGPPARTADGDLATCELCFTGASDAEIAACEMDARLPGLERASNAAFDTAHGLHGETLVAFALCVP